MSSSQAEACSVCRHPNRSVGRPCDTCTLARHANYRRHDRVRGALSRTIRGPRGDAGFSSFVLLGFIGAIGLLVLALASCGNSSLTVRAPSAPGPNSRCSGQKATTGQGSKGKCQALRIQATTHPVQMPTAVQAVNHRESSEAIPAGPPASVAVAGPEVLGPPRSSPPTRIPSEINNPQGKVAGVVPVGAADGNQSGPGETIGSLGLSPKALHDSPAAQQLHPRHSHVAAAAAAPRRPPAAAPHAALLSVHPKAMLHVAVLATSVPPWEMWTCAEAERTVEARGLYPAPGFIVVCPTAIPGNPAAQTCIIGGLCHGRPEIAIRIAAPLTLANEYENSRLLYDACLSGLCRGVHDVGHIHLPLMCTTIDCGGPHLGYTWYTRP